MPKPWAERVARVERVWRISPVMAPHSLAALSWHMVERVWRNSPVLASHSLSVVYTDLAQLTGPGVPLELIVREISAS